MKKYFYLSLMFLLSMAFTACNNNAMTNVLDAIPANAEFVAVGDLSTVLESADCPIVNNQIEISSEVKKLDMVNK